MRAELNKTVLNPRHLVPPKAVMLYFGEVIFALTLAIMLWDASTLEFPIAVLLFVCGVVVWSFAEYLTHRFVLHAIAAGEHRTHHARPQDHIDRILWQIWLAFALVYLTTPGPVLAGVLVAYAWYLSVHYCAHHNPAVLPASLLMHHLDHHKFANRNYGVTTKVWDRVFGTALR